MSLQKASIGSMLITGRIEATVDGNRGIRCLMGRSVRAERLEVSVFNDSAPM
jgi:hypothetical protein